ncbi:hypothetical protein GGG16DRAFT_105240 [Schizophyllum commune]
MPTSPPTMFDRSRRRHTSNSQFAALRNAKSTPIVPRSAPVPLGDRCDTSPWWTGGEERRGAPLRYPQPLSEGWGRREAPQRAPTPSLFLRSFEGQKMRNRWQMRQGPRRCPSLNAATVEVDADERSRVFARRGAERRRHSTAQVEGLRDQQRGALLPSGNRDFSTPSKTKKSANPRQMDRGPRLKFSLMFETVEGGEEVARSAAYIAVSSLSRGDITRRHYSPNRSAVLIERRLDTIQRPFASFGSSYVSSSAERGSFPSSVMLVLHTATLSEPPAPLATPSILVPTYFNLSVPTSCERFDFFVGLS